MKSSSGYQLESPMHKVMQASYQMNLNTSFVTNISTAIMQKVTNVSPFILLLVPFFMMTVISITANINTTDTELSTKIIQHNAVARTSQQLK